MLHWPLRPASDFAVKANIDEVVYLINLDLTNNLWPQDAVRAIYVGLKSSPISLCSSIKFVLTIRKWHVNELPLLLTSLHGINVTPNLDGMVKQVTNDQGIMNINRNAKKSGMC